VLILSEFAGAAAEMAEAIQVNPYDIDRVAAAIEQALEMPEEESRTRMRALRRRVQIHNSYQWADTFLATLASTCDEAVDWSQRYSSTARIGELLQSLRSARRLLLFLDYDGTLVPFAGTPDLAPPDAELKELLTKLGQRPATSIHILSGRTRSTLEKWFGDLPVALHAEHGYWSRSWNEDSWTAIREEPVNWKESVLPLLEQFVVSTPGTLIEEKAAGLAWHYRMADPDFGAIQAQKLMLELERELQARPVEILTGSKVLEVRLHGVSKGAVASRVIALDGGQSTLFAMGDDRTDEDMFAVLEPADITVHVGPGPSSARYRIEDWIAARRLLQAGLLESAPDDYVLQQTATVGGM
jgi:trehalose 6-phosphate synthase/phosphatase